MSLVLGPALIKTTHRSRENVTETIEATGKTCTLHLACPTTLASLHPSNLCLVITTLILCGSDSKLSAAAIYIFHLGWNGLQRSTYSYSVLLILTLTGYFKQTIFGACGLDLAGVARPWTVPYPMLDSLASSSSRDWDWSTEDGLASESICACGSNFTVEHVLSCRPPWWIPFNPP